MRNAILVSILTVVLVVGASAVYAGAPVSGDYKSSLGQFDEGREASAWPGGNGFLSGGNVLFAQSRDGSGFTNDWLIGCPIVAAILPLYDTVDGNGNGHRAYLITYAGGYVQLGGPGMPWDGGDAFYSGAIDTYYETRTLQFAANVMVGSVSDHGVSAHLQGYTATCVTWAIGNGVWLGNSPAPKPADYPDFHDANCGVTGGSGHWGDIRDLTISVQGCAVATQPSTWGGVKALYRE